jgi:hypothetical protein
MVVAVYDFESTVVLFYSKFTHNSFIYIYK